MATPDMDVIKEIPGYKVILKAILKSQIQQLVEQLASHTEEESVFLTASVSDGTLSHLGSDSGKTFLEDHDDLKSQFLGFCLKTHHKKKQQEKERQQQEKERQQQEKERQEMLQNIPTSPAQYEGQRFPPQRSPRFTSPRQHNIHPVSLTRASPRGMGPMGMRHQPYSGRPRRPNFDARGKRPQARMPATPPTSTANNKVIKLEPEDDDSQTTELPSGDNDSAQPSPSRSNTDDNAQNVKSESSKDTDANSELSDTVPAEGLSLDSDLSTLLPMPSDSSGAEDSDKTGGGSRAGVDPDVNVKVEAITESEMELEITGVELAPPGPDPVTMGSPGGWGGEGLGGAGYDTPGASGSQSDLLGSQQGFSNDIDEGYTEVWNAIPVERHQTCTKRKTRPVTKTTRGYKPHACFLCQRVFHNVSNLKRHMRIHQGVYPFECEICHKRFSDKSNHRKHMVVHYIKSSGELIQGGELVMNADGEAIQSGEPIHSGEPIKSREPLHSGERIQSGEPIQSGELIKSREPLHSGELIKSGEPMHSGEPIQSGAPIQSGELIKIGEPLPSGERIKNETHALNVDFEEGVESGEVVGDENNRTDDAADDAASQTADKDSMSEHVNND